MRTLLHRFDHYFARIIQSWPTWLAPIMRVASNVGYPMVTLGGIAGSFLLVGWFVENTQYLVMGIIIIVTHTVSSILKAVVGRKRPSTYITKRWHMKTHSFPSGHACGSAVAYGAVALVMNASVVTIIVTILVLLIGISRIYLGAHYPSDVVVGWILGGIGVLALAVL